MIVRCPDCMTKYEIAASRVPETGVKVRCPKCKAVFPVNRLGAEDPPRPDIAEAEAPAAPTADSPSVRPEIPRPALAAVPGGASPESGGPKPAPGAKTSPATNGEAPRRSSRLVTDPAVARRMARAVIHEMLLPRREEHQRAVENGTVLSTFAPALVDAFDLYLEKLSPDLAGASAVFRDAVNDILGQGKVLF